MSSRTCNLTAFIDNPDPSQPRIAVTIDGGLDLTDDERHYRNLMIKSSVDDVIKTLRTFYDMRRMNKPPWHVAMDASKAKK